MAIRLLSGTQRTELMSGTHRLGFMAGGDRGAALTQRSASYDKQGSASDFFRIYPDGLELYYAYTVSKFDQHW